MLKRMVASFVWMAILATGSGNVTVAQNENSALMGTVEDAQSGDPLPGATVQIEKSGLGASSDAEGKYFIRNVPPGSYRIRAVYIGYIGQEIMFEVKEGETRRLDFHLLPVGVESEEIVVTAQAAGQKAAINQQLSALPVVNVVSRARIQELPDANAAESVSRLPGVSLIRTGGEGSQVVIRGLSPQYNQVTIDGVELPSNIASSNNIMGDPEYGFGLAASGNNLGDRGEDLSMISSSMLGGIKVTKAITPDMDAAVIGGVVDFALRKAVRQESETDLDQSWIPLFEFKVQGGYSKLKNTYDNYQYIGSLEKRFVNQRFGVFVLGSAEKRHLSSNVLEADYTLLDKNDGDRPMPALTSITLADVFRKRQRLGGTVVLDYQHKGGEVALMNFVSSSKTQEITRGEFMDPVALTNQLTYRANEVNNQLNTISNLLSVRQDLSLLRAHLKVSHSYSETLSPEDYGFVFWQLSRGFSSHAHLTNLDPKTLASSALPDAASSFLETIYTTASISKERNITASLDLATDIALASYLSGRIKVGGLVQHRTRTYDKHLFQMDNLIYGDLEAQVATLKGLFPWIITDVLGRVSMLNFTPDAYQYGEFMNGDYMLAYPMNVNKMWDITRTLKRRFGITDRNRMESVINDYSGREDKSAGYAMVSLDFGQSVSIVPGIRYQNLATSYTAMRAMIVPGGWQGGDTTVEYSHGYFLPMVHVRYRPLDWMQVHFAYTKTLNYPDYGTITPRYVIARSSIDYNNHALRPAISENLDLVVSFHSNEIGLLSLNGFKKRIKDLVFFSQTYVSDLSKYPDLPQGRNQLFTFNTYINNPIPVNLYGIEAEWQTHFWYLPKPLDGLVLNINFTHIFSEASYPRSTVSVSYDEEGNMTRMVTDTLYTARMLNQPNDIVNLALGYDLSGFSLRLSLLYQDNIFKRPDFWLQQRVNSAKFTRWDLSLRQELPWWGMQLFFTINNITGADDIDVNQKNGFPTSEQRYGMSAYAGLQVRL